MWVCVSVSRVLALEGSIPTLGRHTWSVYLHLWGLHICSSFSLQSTNMPIRLIAISKLLCVCVPYNRLAFRDSLVPEVYLNGFQASSALVQAKWHLKIINEQLFSSILLQVFVLVVWFTKLKLCAMWDR